MKLNRDAYEDIVAGDIAWLQEQPRTLEREHIIEVLKASPDHEYPKLTPGDRHFTVPGAATPSCGASPLPGCGLSMTDVDEWVTCRKCMVMRGWVEPKRRDEHALDEAKTAFAGQCSCTHADCLHSKIRNAAKALAQEAVEEAAALRLELAHAAEEFARRRKT